MSSKVKVAIAAAIIGALLFFGTNLVDGIKNGEVCTVKKPDHWWCQMWGGGK